MEDGVGQAVLAEVVDQEEVPHSVRHCRYLVDGDALPAEFLWTVERYEAC